MEIDRENLRKLARQASEGPWTSQHHSVQCSLGRPICFVSETRGRFEWEKANRDFIAAANPVAILGLLDMLDSSAPSPEATQEAVDAARYRWICSTFDAMKASESERFLELLGLPIVEVTALLNEPLDSVMAAEKAERS